MSNENKLGAQPAPADEFDELDDVYLDPAGAPPAPRGERPKPPPIQEPSESSHIETPLSLETIEAPAPPVPEEPLVRLDVPSMAVSHQEPVAQSNPEPQAHLNRGPTTGRVRVSSAPAAQVQDLPPAPSEFPRSLWAANEPMSPDLYILCLAVAGVLLIVFHWQMARLLASLRQMQPLMIVGLAYLVWLVGACAGFYLTCQWTTRRWLDAVGGSGKKVALANWAIRAAIVSPLLSIPTAIVVAAMPTGWLAEPGAVRRRFVPAALLALGLFHALYIAVTAKSFARQSAVAGVAKEDRLQTVSTRHVRPYLPITSQYGIRLMEDLERLRKLTGAGRTPASDCRKSVRFGQVVDDCLLQSFGSEAKGRRFASATMPAAFGLADQSGQREREIGALPAAVAGLFVRVDWTLALFESTDGAGLSAPREDVAPRPPALAAFGSPEIPLLNALLDAQRVYMIRKIAAPVEQAVAQGADALAQSQSVLHARDAAEFTAARDSYRKRLAALQARPLAIAR